MKSNLQENPLFAKAFTLLKPGHQRNLLVNPTHKQLIFELTAELNNHQTVIIMNEGLAKKDQRPLTDRETEIITKCQTKISQINSLIDRIRQGK